MKIKILVLLIILIYLIGCKPAYFEIKTTYDMKFLLGYITEKPKLIEKINKTNKNSYIYIECKFRIINQYVTPKTYYHNKLILKNLGYDSIELNSFFQKKSYLSDKVFILHLLVPKEKSKNNYLTKIQRVYKKDELIFLFFPENIDRVENIITSSKYIKFYPRYLDSMLSY